SPAAHDTGRAEARAGRAVPPTVRAGGVHGTLAGQPVALPRRALPPRTAAGAQLPDPVAADAPLLAAGPAGPPVLLGRPAQGRQAVAPPARADGRLHGHVPALLPGARGSHCLGPLAAGRAGAEAPRPPGRQRTQRAAGAARRASR